ncbi:MAG: type II toxin-antitoxin system VapC family toxin [Burkholderiaceae bacterium]|nr:type II toxin-antitoxin system VapC family toxin [Burkholderiaceae bacterium]MCD8515939.1 type II toxin-antitoxin system VapC family toxin [Burkholderiaceae bacterium]MCD8538192.1 type II toxin-antitoxin system VapC family toxin [Burkholderiaceae bacterium]MCD8565849.1 type II toxin-antitoxin system VapC family toxin [Burkholderiaceae bacterium]
MIILDTNVISEAWKIDPDPVVLSWLDSQSVETLFLTTITVAELRFGIAAMPKGKRRTSYTNRLEQDVLPTFEGRVLSFDLGSSNAYGDLIARARSKGKAISKADGYIAAIAATSNLIVATRDVSPFKAAGLKVINPWGLKH